MDYPMQNSINRTLKYECEKYFSSTEDLLHCVAHRNSHCTSELFTFEDRITRHYLPRKDKDIYVTKIHSAVVNKQDISYLETLLKSQQELKNTRNVFGETPLLLALKENVTDDLILKLLEYGCDGNIPCYKGITPLHLAARYNKIKILCILIERGVNVNAETMAGILPIHEAVSANQYEAVEKLLEFKSNPILVTKLQFTPLMMAIGLPNISDKICELLLKYDVDTTTHYGNPLYWAIRIEHYLTYKLINNGANVNFICKYDGVSYSCLEASIFLHHNILFELMWPIINQKLFKNELIHFLSSYTRCEFEAGDFIDSLIRILKSKYSSLMIQHYNRRSSFLVDIFSKLDRFENLTENDYLTIIDALPVVYYLDFIALYEATGFSEKFEHLLLAHKEIVDIDVNSKTDMLIDILYFNEIKSQCLNLKQLQTFLKFCTPSCKFRSMFYDSFSFLREDTVNNLCALYTQCYKKLSERTVPNLQELSRDNIRSIFFAKAKIHKSKPYQDMNNLPVPKLIKDILFLKTPLYS